MVKKRKMGRPTKFTKERVNKFYKYLRKGIPITIACRGVGFSFQSYRNWYMIGEELSEKINNGDISEDELTKDDKDYIDFFETCNVIDLEVADDLISNYKAKSPQGTAERFLLSHRFNPEFGEKSEVSHTGSVDINVSWKDLVKGKDEND